MKIAIFSTDKTRLVGLVTNDGIIDLAKHMDNAPPTMIEVMKNWDTLEPILSSLAFKKADYSLDEVHLHNPISRPGKIMGMGLNYADHAAEADMQIPDEQMWFCKASTSINGPYDSIQLPKVSSALDYEAELVFIIGKRCRHVSVKDAPSVIFGYCAGNDVSVRDWQFKTSQFNLGKSFDSHGPLGPWIVTPDEFDPHNANIRCLVNGELRQNSNTKHFIFNCYEQIACLSQAMTLEPGDIAFTGTPSGVGAVMDPPKWLKTGDVVRVEIDGIGAIENVVKPE
ncbi:MAG: fumarylacetoacetate hydrolase family protein [Parasphingorhabdus sp.]|uniref:fumarylacetoacetate hydrolase family protein n=1 Tax=Parasphingorhabdus sp. TaxID=2709688 RepID=UPI003002A05C